MMRYAFLYFKFIEFRYLSKYCSILAALIYVAIKMK